MDNPTEDAYSVYLQHSQYLQNYLKNVLPNVLHSRDFYVPDIVTEDLQSLLLATISLIHLIKLYKNTELMKPLEANQVQLVDQTDYKDMFRILTDYCDSTGKLTFGHYCSLCNYYVFNMTEWQRHVFCKLHVDILNYLKSTNVNARYTFQSCTVCLLVFFGETDHIDSILSSESHRTFHLKMENILLKSSSIQATFPRVPKKWILEDRRNGTALQKIPRQTQNFEPPCNLAKSPEPNLNEEETENPKLKYSTVVLSGSKNSKTNPKISKDQIAQNHQPEVTFNGQQNMPHCLENKMDHQHQSSQNHKNEWQVVSNKKYVKRSYNSTKMNKSKNTYSSSFQGFKQPTESKSTNFPKQKRNFAPKRKPFQAQEDTVQKSSLKKNENQKSKNTVRPQNNVQSSNWRQPMKVHEGPNIVKKATKLPLSEDKELKLPENENNALAVEENKEKTSLEEKETGEENKVPNAAKMSTSEHIASSGKENESPLEAGKLPGANDAQSDTENEAAKVGKLNDESNEQNKAPDAGKLPSDDVENDKIDHQETTKEESNVQNMYKCTDEGNEQNKAPDAGKLPSDDVENDKMDHQETTKEESNVQNMYKCTDEGNEQNKAPDAGKLPSDDVENDKIDHHETTKEESNVGKKKNKRRRKKNKKYIINESVEEIIEETSDVVQLNVDDLFAWCVEDPQSGKSQFIFTFDGSPQILGKIDMEGILQKLKIQKVISNFSFIGVCLICDEMFDRCEWSEHLNSHQYIETEWCEKCDTSFCGDIMTLKEIFQHPFHVSIDDYMFKDAFFIIIKKKKREDFMMNGKFDFVGYCLNCDLEFNKNNWDKHVESHNKSNECITCDECNTSFYGDKLDIDSLLKSRFHFSIHSIAVDIEDLILKIFDMKKSKFNKDDNPEFIGLCVACSIIIESSFDWCEHLDVHNGDKVEELSCEECNTSFLGPKDTIETLCFNNKNHKNIHSLYS